MKVKILFDPDGEYGYGKRIVDANEFVNDFIFIQNILEETDTISELKAMPIEKAVDFVADKWRIDYELVETIHYRVNIGHKTQDCFRHFDDEKKMFKWISERIGMDVDSFYECEEWTRKHNGKCGLYIEILTFENVKDFYFKRCEYMQIMNRCDNALTKARRRKGNRRAIMCEEFDKNYEAAQVWADIYPEVWQGEI